MPEVGRRVIIDRGRIAAALPGYRIGAELGAGAFGLVVAARHRRLKRDVAVKVIPAESPVAGEEAAEAELLASLDHPHIVRVHDYIEADGLGLIVMELLGGGPLTRRQRSLDHPQICAVGLAVAAGLAHAHAHGILHRDIKMGNILFDTVGTAKLGDFGIARVFTGSGITGTAFGAGTPMYMAPEQIVGGRLGPATDLYALGVVLYQLLTGAPPFDPTLPPPQLWQRHLTSPPPPMHGVPQRIAEVVLHALAKDPAERPGDADSFAAALASAAVATYGTSCIANTGLPLHLTNPIRHAVTERAKLATRPNLATHRPGPPTYKPLIFPIAPKSDTTNTRWQLSFYRTILGIPGSRPLLTGLTLPDQRTLLAVATDGEVGLWDPISGHRAGPSFIGPPGQVLALTSIILPGRGTFLATTTGRGVQIWDPVSGEPIAKHLTGHTGRVLALGSVTLPGQRALLATSGEDATVRLWDPISGQLARPPIIAHCNWLLALASITLPGGRTLLASAGVDGKVWLWDPASGDLAGEPFTGHTEIVRALTSVALPDGRTLLASAGDDPTMRLWDPNSGQPAGGHLAVDTGRIGAMASIVLPGGRTLLATARDCEPITVWTWTHDPAIS